MLARQWSFWFFRDRDDGFDAAAAQVGAPNAAANPDLAHQRDDLRPGWHRRSATRWTLMVRPPRERPSTSPSAPAARFFRSVRPRVPPAIGPRPSRAGPRRGLVTRGIPGRLPAIRGRHPRSARRRGPHPRRPLALAQLVEEEGVQVVKGRFGMAWRYIRCPGGCPRSLRVRVRAHRHRHGKRP